MSSRSEDQDEDDGLEWEEVDVDHRSSPTLGTYTIVLSKAEDQPTSKKRNANSLIERQIRHQVHRMHTITLLIAGSLRNRLLNDGLLKARLLSLVPLPLINAFNYFSPETHPLARDRSRLFDSALRDLISWWWQSFQTNDSLDGMISRNWNGAEALYNHLTRSAQGDAQDAFLQLLESGEPIHGVKSLMKRAVLLKGSRDMSAQLFTSLLRALNIPARLVFSLQPVTWRGAGAGGKSANPPSAPSDSSTSAFKPHTGKTKPESVAAQNSHLQAKRGEWATKALKVAKAITSKTANPPAYSGKERQLDRAMNDKETEDERTSFGIEPAGVPSQGSSTHAPIIKLRKSKPLKSKNWTKSPSPEPQEMNRPPTFWIEVYSRPLKEWYCVDVTRKRMRCKNIMEPSRSNFENKMIYVIAYEEDHFIRDVTARYAHSFGATTLKARLPSRKNEPDWFEQYITLLKRPYRLDRDIQEDTEIEKAQVTEAMPTTCIGFKNHPKYALERHLKREEVIYPKKPIGTFRGDPVYPRSSVIVCKSTETYMREGKRVKGGENPLKMVKPRTVTINRKREVELLKMDGQQPPLQGLYAEWQTELLIPPPIVGGVIPRNAYGNFDLFAPHMLPKGAKHLSYKGIAKTAKRLQVSYADAVVAFEFHKNRATPLIEGIIVPELEAEFVLDAYWTSEEAAEHKELQKLEERCLKRWKKLIIGLRIKQRLREEYVVANSQKPIEGTSQFKTLDPEPHDLLLPANLIVNSTLELDTDRTPVEPCTEPQADDMERLPSKTDGVRSAWEGPADFEELNTAKNAEAHSRFDSVNKPSPSSILEASHDLSDNRMDRSEPSLSGIRHSTRHHQSQGTVGAAAVKGIKRKSAVGNASASTEQNGASIIARPTTHQPDAFHERIHAQNSLNSSPLSSPPLESDQSDYCHHKTRPKRVKTEVIDSEGLLNIADQCLHHQSKVDIQKVSPITKRSSRVAAAKARQNIPSNSPTAQPVRRTLRPRK